MGLVPNDIPGNDIGEVTLIGTGGGYGESCVVHLGNQEWLVVDSCRNPKTKKSLPLEYLENIGVDVSKNVKLIACTHWHDDHILGLSELFEKCPNAQLCMAHPNDMTKFLYFVDLDYKKIKDAATISSTIEFNKCIDILNARGGSIVQTLPNRVLYSSSSSSVYSLSPSDFILGEYDKAISSLITEFGSPSKKIILKSPNSQSVVLFVKLGNHRALLGADLEATTDEREGWLNILNNQLSVVIDKKATLFKIAHHGSETGYHERIWTELLEKEPISKLTPWNRKNKLPNAQMLNKFCSKSDKVFITSPIVISGPKKRNKQTEKIIRQFKLKLREAKFHKGIIRGRIDMNDPLAKWQIKLFEEAFHVKS